ncbi:MAG: putative rane protein [Kosmotoga sp.]|nr:putative rane protein [Kosmotoga sp.]
MQEGGAFLINSLIGLLMGIANLIPGVSGGTIALVSGIYGRLMNSIATLTELKFKKKDLLFLFQLVAGIAVGIFAFSRLVEYSIDTFPSLTYGFFAGLVAGGIPSVYIRIGKFTPKKIISLVAGVLLVLLLSLWGNVPNAGYPAHSNHSISLLLYDWLAGFVGAASMILPGLSGSFVLLIMGEYERIISAINDLDLLILLFVAVGIVIGTIFITRIIRMLLKKMPGKTFSFLMGLMLGSFPDLLSRPGKETRFFEISVGLVLGAMLSIAISKLEGKKIESNT